MNRKPIACPDYYPTTFDKLDKAINESFMHKKGPGTLQSSRRNIPLNLIIVPCDKIKKCGPCSAWGYMEIAESNFPTTYLLLGTNHHSKTKFSTYLFTNWETPFGIIKTNVDLGKELTDIFPQILNEHTGHVEEHSIEIQLPWLQFASRDNLQELSFIPLTINTTAIKDIKKLAEVLSKFTKKHKITEEMAKVISKDKALAEMFEAVSTAVNPELAAKWIRRELPRVLNYNKKKLHETEIKEHHMVDLLTLIEEKKITETTAQRIIEKLVEKPFDIKEYVKKEKLEAVSDTSELEKLCKQAIKEAPKAVEEYKAGKEKALNFIVGLVMKATKGKASPKEVNEILKKLIEN